MVSYINGITDYVPQLQNFQPDLNFYASALATKQNQYDQNLNKLSSIYSSAFNSSMTRGDNIERRSNYFKTIEQQIQKVASLDLSIDQNVNASKSLFDPILNDRHIIKDITYTKGLDNSYQRGEQFRNCVDPEKCGGEYWQEGIDALNYAQEEFQNASPDDSLRFQAPEYVPYQNITKKAVKAAKDAGFNVSYDYKSADGRYLVTDTNGQLLLGPDGQGVLPQYLYGLFGNDSSVQKMYTTQAYVQRKNYAKSNAQRFGGSEDMAESEYLNNIMLQTVPKINKAKEDLTNLRNTASVDKKALEILAENNPNQDVLKSYQEIQNILNSTDASAVYHEQVANLIETAPNLNDIRALRNRVDSVVANSNFMGTLNAAAYDYAMGTAKQEQKADPYALESFKTGLDISKYKQQKAFDDQIWTKQQLLLGNIGGGVDSQNGLNQEQYNALSKIPESVLRENGIFKLDKKGLDKADQLGLLNPVRLDKAGNFVILPANDSFENTYYEQSKVVNDAVASEFNTSDVFVRSQVDAMKESFKNADAIYGPDKALGYKAKLMVDLTSLVGANAGAIMRGETDFKLNPKKVSTITKKALEIRQRNVASRIYNDNYDDAELLKVQAAIKTADDFYKMRSSELKSSLETAQTNIKSEYDQGNISVADRLKKSALINTVANINTGEMIDPDKAKSLYVKHSANIFGDDYRYDGRLGTQILVKTGQQRASDYFDKNYGTELSDINKRLTSFKGAPTDNTTGGTSLSKYSLSTNFIGNQPIDPNSLLISNIIKDIQNNPEGKPLTFTGINSETGLVGLGSNVSNPEKAELFQKIADRIRNKDTKDLNIQTELLYVPTTFDRDAFSKDETTDAIYRNPGDVSKLPGKTTNPSVFVKMTIPEKEYRTMNNIKSDEKVNVADRTLIVKNTSESNGKFLGALTPFIEGIKETPEELYLSKVGRSIPFDLGGKGTALVERIKVDEQSTKLQTTITVPIFNSKDGTWTSGTMNYFVDSPKIDDIYRTISSQVNQINLENKKAAAEYARTIKSK